LSSFCYGDQSKLDCCPLLRVSVAPELYFSKKHRVAAEVHFPKQMNDSSLSEQLSIKSAGLSEETVPF
jgi:hypothetical protein